MYAIVPEESDEGLRELAKSWWLLLIMGIGWLLFAWVVLSFEFKTVWAIAVFAGVGFIVGGVSEIVMATRLTSWRWLYFMLGFISIVAGVMCFIWPGQTFLVLAAILAWYLLFKGVLDIFQAFATKKYDDMWWLTLLVGLAEVLIGFWAVGYSGRSVALLVVWVGAMALSRGIVSIILAFKVRSFGEGTGPTPAVA